MSLKNSAVLLEKKLKKSMRIGIRTLLLPHRFYLCQVQRYIFYEAFLNISPILNKRLINFGFIIEEDF